MNKHLCFQINASVPAQKKRAALILGYPEPNTQLDVGKIKIIIERRKIVVFVSSKLMPLCLLKRN